jgi:predicted XRE-type DNA-binding protein
MGNSDQIHDSSGSIFQDMGMHNAELRLAKAELARLIRRKIAARGVTPTEAAELLGVSRPELADLVRGRLAPFGISRLANLLNRLDLGV